MPHMSATVMLAMLAVMGLAGLFCVVVMKTLLVICRPNEIVVVFGGRYPGPDGVERGWYAMTAGRRLRVPLVEKVERFDLTPMPIEVDLSDVYASNGLPLRVRANARVTISSDFATLEHAVERFLGVEKQKIARVAQETLESNIREVIDSVTMSAEELDRTRIELAAEIHRNATPDFEKLGLHLDNLQIQKVAVDRDARSGEEPARPASSQFELLEI